MSVSSFLVYSDPSHSWIKVKKSTLKFYFGDNWRKHFTSFSYERNWHVYLEEDQDARTFIDKLKSWGSEPRFRVQQTKGNRLSRIRDYDCLAPIELS